VIQRLMRYEAGALRGSIQPGCTYIPATYTTTVATARARPTQLIRRSPSSSKSRGRAEFDFD
jgi:hypothetical protein